MVESRPRRALRVSFCKIEFMRSPSLDLLILVLLDSGVEVAAVKVDPASNANDGKFFLENEVLDRLFRPPEVDRCVFHVQQCGLDVASGKTQEKALDFRGNPLGDRLGEFVNGFRHMLQRGGGLRPPTPARKV